MRIVTAQEMARADRRAAVEWGVPTLLMMEHAGRGVAEVVRGDSRSRAGSPVLVLAGKGNNGGDALAAARHLALAGLDVEVVLLAQRIDLKADPRLMLGLAERCGVPVAECASARTWEELRDRIDSASAIIDGIFGTGLSKPISGWLADLVEAVNHSPAPVFSIDIPSGLSGDRSDIPGPAIAASVTVALGLPKPPLVLPPAESLAGEVRVVGLGVPIEALLDKPSPLDLLDDAWVGSLIPERAPDAHKGDFGRILAIVGSRGKPGAGALVCIAALRSGAGLVTAATPQSAHAAVASHRPEVMVEPLPETPAGGIAWAALDRLRVLLDGKDLILAGPGLGTEPDTVQVLQTLVGETRLPLVLDADALNAFAGKADRLSGRERTLVLTPHPGEMARLTGSTAAAVQEDRLKAARDLALGRGCHVVLKGHRTLVAAPDGHVDVNPTGNPGLATAGTGDVLTGMIGGFLAQGLEPQDALRCAVYLHGRAADLAARDKGEIPLVALDVLDHLPRALRSLSPSWDEGVRARPGDSLPDHLRRDSQQ
jgi:NAD(P)H-hydrate epimerase